MLPNVEKSQGNSLLEQRSKVSEQGNGPRRAGENKMERTMFGNRINWFTAAFEGGFVGVLSVAKANWDRPYSENKCE